jgi:hypothetical protein
LVIFSRDYPVYWTLFNANFDDSIVNEQGVRHRTSLPEIPKAKRKGLVQGKYKLIIRWPPNLGVGGSSWLLSMGFTVDPIDKETD